MHVAWCRGLAGKAGAARKGLDKLLADHPDLGKKLSEALPVVRLVVTLARMQDALLYTVAHQSCLLAG
jgi:hypothetical protein